MGPIGDFTGVRRTKLICTIGPATADRIGDLVDAGMDVARINFSHGDPRSHEAAAQAVRAAAQSRGRPLAILMDLAGPKIRLGPLVDGAVALETGQHFRLRVDGAKGRMGDASGAFVSEPRLIEVEIGDPVYLGDGVAELRVTHIDDATRGGGVETEVLRGGLIRSGAGVAVPAMRLSSPALTKRDRGDIARAISIGCTYLGQSFVRNPEDVRALREMLGPDGPKIIAKIETRPAVDAFDELLGVVDAVMIARGDLGVEIPFSEVPVIQKQLLGRAIDRGIPSIVATQMLESMVAAPRPTRAEASDVANAVFDGADGLLLSSETAIGAYPVEAVETASRIALVSEARGTEYLRRGSLDASADGAALASAAIRLVEANGEIAAIACYTRTGRTALLLSSFRPRVPIIAFSPDRSVVDRLALLHGIIPRSSVDLDEEDRLVQLRRVLGSAGLVADGALVAFVTSTSTSGSAPNVLAVQHVTD